MSDRCEATMTVATANHQCTQDAGGHSFHCTKPIATDDAGAAVILWWYFRIAEPTAPTLNSVVMGDTRVKLRERT